MTPPAASGTGRRRGVGTILLAAAGAALLSSPSLSTGLASDDWFLALAFGDADPVPGFGTEPGAMVPPGAAPDGIAAGVLPWTTDPDFSLSFFRPLAMATHAADWALGLPPWAMHAHSIAWGALLVGLAALLYRRIGGPGPASALAAALLAVEDARAPAIGWIANRNIVVAGVFVVVALLAHDRWRRSGWRPGAFVAPAGLVLGLLSSEAALGAWGYLIAHAAFLDGRRWRGLLGPAAATAGWLAVWLAGDHGVTGSWVYADPAHDPIGAIRHVARTAPILLGGQVTGVWSEIAAVLPPERLPAIAAAGAIALLGAFALLAPALRRPEDAFWAVGAAGAVLPVSLSFPSDRVLVLVSLGAAPLFARAILAARPTGRRRGLRMALAAGLLLVHGALSVPAHLLRARGMADIQGVYDRADAALPRDPSADVVLLHLPSDSIPAFLAARRGAERVGRPHLRAVASTLGGLRVTREDDRTLRVRPERGWLDGFGERLLRNPERRPFVAGEVIDLPDVHVEIVDVLPDGRPAEARFRWPTPLEDRAWWTWGEVTLVPWIPPPIGATVTRPPIDGLRALEG